VTRFAALLAAVLAAVAVVWWHHEQRELDALRLAASWKESGL